MSASSCRSSISLLLLVFIWYFIRNAVTGPLEHMVAGFRSIASGDGDLTHRLEVQGKDEIGQASSAFNDMMAKFSGLGQEVASGIERIASMAQENSNASTQTASAARALESLADELQGAVGRFKT